MSTDLDKNQNPGLLKASRLMEQGDIILLSRHKFSFYKEAEKALLDVPDDEPEKTEMLSVLQKKQAMAAAGIPIEMYRQACVMMNHARSQDEYSSAILRFEEAEKSCKEKNISPELLSDDIRAEYEELNTIRDKIALCKKKSASLFHKKRAKGFALLLIIIILLVGALAGIRTAAFREVLGRAELIAGMNESAAKNLKSSYNKSEKDETYSAYVKALYKQGKAAFNSGDYAAAADVLHIPAEEQFEDADVLAAEADQEVVRNSSVGDSVTIGGCQWLVLDKTTESAVLIRYEGMQAGAFHAEANESAAWTSSDMKAMLNTTYLNETFSQSEQALLLNGTAEDTIDCKVWLLNADEYTFYYDTINECGHDCWLRNSGEQVGNICYVNTNKEIMDYGYPADAENMYIKPVICFNLTDKTEE